MKFQAFCKVFAGCIATLMLAALAMSCNKSSNANPSGTNVRLQIANFSPDAYPVAFYLNGVQQNSTSTTGSITATPKYYTYNSPSGYFYLTSTTYPLQIRSTKSAGNILSNDTVNLKSNTKYSLFITGLDADGKVSSVVLVDDTAALPAAGKGGKIRYVNLTSRADNTPFDIYANGTLAFQNILWKKVSVYRTLPAGNYTFTAYPTGTNTGALTSVSSVNIQDGHLYTLYSQGLVGHTDSAALSLGVLSNTTIP